jgi:glycosyltransferase involved in cell wall biosynthesis
MNPLVTVVIPGYNQAHTIDLCVRSAREQTCPGIEIIVVDDASTDDTAAIAAASGATVLRLPGNRGPSAARNLGAAQARGEILFFLDADVALAPGSVAAAVAALRLSPRLGAICGVLGPDSLVSRTAVAKYRGLQMHHWWLAREGNMTGLHTAICAMRADVFRKLGPFRPELRHTEAPEYGERLVRHGYEVRSTAAIAGLKDHDATLRILLPKVFRRARATAQQWRSGELPSVTGPRALASGLLLLAVLAAPLPLVAGLAGAVVMPLLVAAAMALDAATYRRVVASRGIRSGLGFTAIHLLYQLTSATAAGLGSVERLLRGGAR